MEKIDSALITAYKALNLGVVTAYPNGPASFIPPANAPWISVVNVPVTDNAVTLGATGQDEVTGYFQITVNDQVGNGTGTISHLRGLIRAGMIIGQAATYLDQVVYYTFRRFPPIVTNGAYAVGIVQVYWRTRNNRS